MLHPEHFISWAETRDDQRKLGDLNGRHTSPAWNVVSGTVLAIHQGLTRTGVRIRVGEHAIVRIRCTTDLSDGQRVQIGQQVAVKIAPDAVLLGAPGVWPGRIVLVEPGMPYGMVTVKIFGEQWTLKTIRPVSKLGRAPQAWDTVNIVVDPAAARMDVQKPSERVPRFQWTTVGTSQGITDARVWMKGKLSGSVSPVPSGWFLPLEIGSARVGAVVDPAQSCLRELKAGSEVEVHIGQSEVWLRPGMGECLAIPCRLVYTSGAIGDRLSIASGSCQDELKR
jgi:hypothetical protein